MTGNTVGEKAQLIVGDILALPISTARKLIVIAGPPAAGKSTIAAYVKSLMEAKGHPTGIVPMDGFHYDNQELQARGLLARKGAPETFDLDGLAATIRRLKSEAVVKVPLFDRESDRTLPDAGCVMADEIHVVIEGNYLLFDEPGWRDLAAYWDYSVFIEEHFDELTRRLHQRWTDNGLETSEARNRTEANDLPNALRVLNHRLPAQRAIRN